MASELICPDCGGVIGAGPDDARFRCVCSGGGAAADDTEVAVAPPPAAKVCVNCGKDVTGQKRAKDSRGYWCYECHKEDMRKEKGADKPRVRCPDCGRGVPADSLINFDGIPICQKCRAERSEMAKEKRRFRPSVGTKHYDLQEKTHDHPARGLRCPGAADPPEQAARDREPDLTARRPAGTQLFLYDSRVFILDLLSSFSSGGRTRARVPQRLYFKKCFHAAVRDGRKTTTLRRWAARRVKAGGTARSRPGVGWLRVEAVERVVWEELTGADARADGFDSLAALAEAVAKRSIRTTRGTGRRGTGCGSG